jgi:hypothetical protein
MLQVSLKVKAKVVNAPVQPKPAKPTLTLTHFATPVRGVSGMRGTLAGHSFEMVIRPVPLAEHAHAILFFTASYVKAASPALVAELLAALRFMFSCDLDSGYRVYRRSDGTLVVRTTFGFRGLTVNPTHKDVKRVFEDMQASGTLYSTILYQICVEGKSCAHLMNLLTRDCSDTDH